MLSRTNVLVPPLVVIFDPFVPFVRQKSNWALILKSRADVTDTGDR